MYLCVTTKHLSLFMHLGAARKYLRRWAVVVVVVDTGSLHRYHRHLLVVVVGIHSTAVGNFAVGEGDIGVVEDWLQIGPAVVAGMYSHYHPLHMGAAAVGTWSQHCHIHSHLLAVVAVGEGGTESRAAWGYHMLLGPVVGGHCCCTAGCTSDPASPRTAPEPHLLVDDVVACGVSRLSCSRSNPLLHQRGV